MEKSQQGISSGVSVAAVVKDTTVARSKSSRKNAEKRISKGPGLSKSDSVNIVMNALNSLQEHFGGIHFVAPEPGSVDPALLVLPLKLSVCRECGLIIERSDGEFCKWHGASFKNVTVPEAQVA